MATILPTRNEAWGFHGAIAAHADPARAWPLAFVAVGAACDAEPYAVRAFLDSRQGRHFADGVADRLACGIELAEAVEAETLRWLTWTIGRGTSRETGIPAGLPYLVGRVLDEGFAVEAELAE